MKPKVIVMIEIMFSSTENILFLISNIFNAKRILPNRSISVTAKELKIKQHFSFHGTLD